MLGIKKNCSIINHHYQAINVEKVNFLKELINYGEQFDNRLINHKLKVRNPISLKQYNLLD